MIETKKYDVHADKMNIKQMCYQVYLLKEEYGLGTAWVHVALETQSLIRKHVKAHNRCPIIVKHDDSPPTIVGQGGHYVDRPKGKTMRYVCSTLHIQVGFEWMQKNIRSKMMRPLSNYYHSMMLGVKP